MARWEEWAGEGTNKIRCRSACEDKAPAPNDEAVWVSREDVIVRTEDLEINHRVPFYNPWSSRNRRYRVDFVHL